MDGPETAITILLTNDDGINAEGLKVLYQTLVASGHRVFVVAPERERSAVGHSITLHKPLRVSRVVGDGGIEGWAVTGTPADCVKLAVAELLDRRPDLVISGINPGANVGINLNYSGTVAAAREAALCGIKALAVSLEASGRPRYEHAARFIARLAVLVDSQPLEAGSFLNVNIPDAAGREAMAVRVGRQGCNYYGDAFEKRTDPRNRSYYWQSVASLPASGDDGSDCALLGAGYITITPVRCDMTDHELLDRMRTWNFDLIDQSSGNRSAVS